jgi:hypothetical protein
MAKKFTAVASKTVTAPKGADKETVIEGKVIPVYDGKGAKEAKFAWVTALKGIDSARGTLRKAFASAVLVITGTKLDSEGKAVKGSPILGKTKEATKAKVLLRATLVEWSKEAGIKAVTAASEVSRQMGDAGLAIRKSSKAPDKDRVNAAAKILDLVHKAFPEAGDVEIKSLLRLAWQSI